MVTTSSSTATLVRVAVDLGPNDGAKAEYWARIAAGYLDAKLSVGPVSLVLRDSHGIVEVNITSTTEVSAALASATTGEPVPVNNVDVYIGVWRNDLDAAKSKGVYIVSDDRFPMEPAMAKVAV